MRRMTAALVCVVATVAVSACTDGTTPDCAAVNCGPNLDGSPVTDTGVDGAPAPDSGADAGRDGASDGASDAPLDAPKDAPLG